MAGTATTKKPRNKAPKAPTLPKLKKPTRAELAACWEQQSESFRRWNDLLGSPFDMVAFLMAGTSDTTDLAEFVSDLQEDLAHLEELVEESGLPEEATLADLRQHLEANKD